MGNLLVWKFAKPASLRHFFYIRMHLRPIRKFRPTPFPLTACSERCNQTECPPFPIWEIEISRPMLLEEIFVFQADQLGKPASVLHMMPVKNRMKIRCIRCTLAVQKDSPGWIRFSIQPDAAVRFIVGCLDNRFVDVSTGNANPGDDVGILTF